MQATKTPTTTQRIRRAGTAFLAQDLRRGNSGQCIKRVRGIVVVVAIALRFLYIRLLGIELDIDNRDRRNARDTSEQRIQDLRFHESELVCHLRFGANEAKQDVRSAVIVTSHLLQGHANSIAQFIVEFATKRSWLLGNV